MFAANSYGPSSSAEIRYFGITTSGQNEITEIRIETPVTGNEIVVQGNNFYLEAKIYGSYIGSLSANWLVDGNSVGISNVAKVTIEPANLISPPLPSNELGSHAVSLEVNVPNKVKSNVVNYTVIVGSKTAQNLKLTFVNHNSVLYMGLQTPVNMKIEILDQEGALVTNYVGSAQLRITQGVATIDPAFVSIQNGIGYFKLSGFKSTGPLTIEAQATSQIKEAITLEVYKEEINAFVREIQEFSEYLKILNFQGYYQSQLVQNFKIQANGYNVAGLERFLEERIFNREVIDPYDIEALKYLHDTLIILGLYYSQPFTLDRYRIQELLGQQDIDTFIGAMGMIRENSRALTETIVQSLSIFMDGCLSVTDIPAFDWMINIFFQAFDEKLFTALNNNDVSLIVAGMLTGVKAVAFNDQEAFISIVSIPKRKEIDEIWMKYYVGKTDWLLQEMTRKAFNREFELGSFENRSKIMTEFIRDSWGRQIKIIKDIELARAEDDFGVKLLDFVSKTFSCIIAPFTKEFGGQLVTLATKLADVARSAAIFRNIDRSYAGLQDNIANVREATSLLAGTSLSSPLSIESLMKAKSSSQFSNNAQLRLDKMQLARSYFASELYSTQKEYLNLILRLKNAITQLDYDIVNDLADEILVEGRHYSLKLDRYIYALIASGESAGSFSSQYGDIEKKVQSLKSNTQIKAALISFLLSLYNESKEPVTLGLISNEINQIIDLVQLLDINLDNLNLLVLGLPAPSFLYMDDLRIIESYIGTEETTISAVVHNVGGNTAEGVSVKIHADSIAFLVKPESVSIGDLEIGQSQDVSFKIKAREVANIANNVLYTVRLVPQASSALAIPKASRLWIDTTSVVSVEETNDFPADYSLFQNYPNPFNPETKIEYHLPADSDVVLRIFNLLGQEVTKLVDERKQAGIHEAIWNGQNKNHIPVSTGVYLIEFEAGSFVTVKKMLLVR